MNDPAFDLWPASISTQAVQCLSIITTCIPYLKPFLTSLESGLYRADDLRRRGVSDIHEYSNSRSNIQKSGEFRSGTYQSKSDQSKLGKVLSKVFRQGSEGHELQTMPTTSLQLRPDPAAAVSVVEGDRGEWDGQSQSSQSRIIKETRTWNVQIQEAETRATGM